MMESIFWTLKSHKSAYLSLSETGLPGPLLLKCPELWLLESLQSDTKLLQPRVFAEQEGCMFPLRSSAVLPGSAKV